MGRTKAHIESETMDTGAGNYRTSRTRREQNHSLGRAARTVEHEPSFRELSQQIYFRWKRNWIALRFRFHRSTFGIFQIEAVRKGAFLAAIAGVCWFTNLLEFLPFGNFVSSETENFEPRNTRQEVISNDGGGEARPVALKNKGNLAAPVSASDLRGQEALDYIERYASVAQVEMRKFGIPASISLAQGLVESRAGHSTLARRNNNHFGMKCFSKKCAKGHCSNFTDDHHKDFFRIYQNSWESWRAHSQMLASGRYTTLKKYGKDYRNWAYGLKTLGYATDRNYAEKLIGMIEKYDLQKYD